MDSKVLDKIRKLLALTASPNENEAAVAATKAQQLLLQHKLTMADVDAEMGTEEEPVTHSTVDMGVGPFEVYRWALALASGVCQATFCNYVWHKGFVTRHGVVGRKCVSFIGRPLDVEAAKELYTWLGTQIYRMGLESISERPLGTDATRWRNSFLDGCALRVERRLAELVHEQAHDSDKVTAIVRTSEQDNEDYRQRTWTRMSKARVNSAQRRDAEAMARGYAAGDTVAIHRTDNAVGVPAKALGQ